jgi:hypothetical protein
VPSKRIFAPLDVFQEWYRNPLAVNFKDYRFTGLVFKASFDNGDGSDAHTFEGDQDGYYETTGQLVQWSIRSYRNVTMTLTARVKKMPPAAAALARSTLRRAEGRVPDLRTKLGTGGHPAAQIRRQWICKWIDCPRFGRTCWWGVKNVPQYHVPIQRAHIHAWSRGIFDGKLTPKDPGGGLSYSGRCASSMLKQLRTRQLRLSRFTYTTMARLLPSSNHPSQRGQPQRFRLRSRARWWRRVGQTPIA